MKYGICIKTFTTSTNLKIHMKIHTREQSFKWEICHKVFSQAQNLNVHTRTHTGEKPYMCDVCKKTFRCKALLKIHIIHIYTIQEKNLTSVKFV